MSEHLRHKLYVIIFGTDTPAGKLFDVVLIYTILLSVVALMLDSVEDVHRRFSAYLFVLEWFLTIVFTAEYLVRLYCSPNRWRYVFSFYGMIDLLSTLPTYLSLIFPGANYLLIIRLLRVLRVFRVFKLVRYINEANSLITAMYAARRKVLVFFFVVINLAAIFGSLMYIVEGPQYGFTSIPKSIYWTIVTITTVGYGDITPHTALGQIIASFAMLTGYSIIAVPTGIFTAELAHEMQRERNLIMCPNCGTRTHEISAVYCYSCGGKVNTLQPFHEKIE
jgi:voltage-gated potassium channel